MKHFISMMFIAGLFLIWNPVFGQDQERMKEILQEFQSRRWLLYQEAQERPTYRTLWNGQGGNWLVARVILRTGGEDWLGLSEEQNQRLAFLRKENEIAQELFQRKFQQQDPDLLEAYEATQRAIPVDDPFFEKATEQQEREYVAINEKVFSFADHYMDEEVADVLTPEQILKVQTFKLQVLPEMGFPVPSMFEPLGLSDAQREDMAAIQGEMEAEFNLLLDEAMGLRQLQLKEMVDLMTESLEGKIPESWEELNGTMRKAGEKSVLNEEFQKKVKANKEKGEEFATRFKYRLMNILTDEQLDRMQELIENMPDFARSIFEQKRKQREEAEKKDIWMPGPDSWRPGDGVPEQFKKERKRGNFPSGL